MTMFKTHFLSICLPAAAFWIISSCYPHVASAQTKDGVVLRGRIAYQRGEKKRVPYEQIEVKLRERVEIPPVPVPRDFQQRKPEEQKKWLEAFEKSDAGKNYIARRDKLIDDAKVFDVVIEKNGSFILYDIPAGIYGIQGRVDKEIEETVYAFEVFGEIAVSSKIDELPLAPILIEITPLLQYEQAAPPIDVTTYNNKSKLNLSTYKGKYLFVNFWRTDNPDIEIQRRVQKMYADLKDKHPLKLLSICMDEKRKTAVKFIVDKKLKEGSHGFTDGWDHPTVDAYGVRSTPSFWLIDPNREIIMTQYNFAQAFNIGNRDLAQIVSDRIEGKDAPTPAKKEK